MRDKVNFRALSTKAKVEYIWGYYRWHILGSILGIAIIVSAIFRAVTYKEPLLSVIMLNSYDSISGSSVSGFDEFFKRYGYQEFDGALELNKNLYFYDDDENIQESYQAYEAMIAMMLTGDYEVFLGSGDVYLEFVKLGFFADLSEILPEDLYETYKEQMIVSNDTEDDSKYPAAITLENHPWLIENNFYHEECYFGVLKDSNTPEIAAEFAEFLLTYQKK